MRRESFLPWVTGRAQLRTQERQLEQLLLANLLLVRFHFLNIPCQSQHIVTYHGVEGRLTVNADEAAPEMISTRSSKVQRQATSLKSGIVGERREGINDHTALGVSGSNNTGMNAEDTEVGLFGVEVLVEFDDGELTAGVGADAGDGEGGAHADQVDDCACAAAGRDEVVR